VADDLKGGAKIFGGQVIKEVQLEDWEVALVESETNASDGKYIMKCE